MGNRRTAHKKDFSRQKSRAKIRSNKAITHNRSKALFLTICILAVAGAILISHWPILSAKTLSFDDSQYLTENHLVQNPSWQSTKRFLTEILEPSTVQGYYQPLAMISLMTDYAIGGRVDNLMPFHRTSLVLHIINTSLVILLVYLLFGHIWAAGIVGLIFGMHPMTVEPVCWVGERKTLLAAFFSLLCLISYVRYSQTSNRKLYILTIILYILALMSKPTSTPLPVLLLLLDYWPLRRLSKKAIVEKVPLFVICGISAVITMISQGRTATIITPLHRTSADVFFILCHNIVFYPYKMLLPLNLWSHYTFPEPMNMSNPMVCAGVVGSCIFAVVVLFSVRRTRSLLTCWLFFFIAIFPTMGIIGFTNVIASDKFAYLPSLGFLILLAFGIICLSSKTKSGNSAATKNVIICIFLVLAGLELKATRKYLTHWRDTETFLEYNISKAPKAFSLYNGLGLFRFKQDRIDEAVRCYEQALKLNPNDAEGHNNLGVALATQGKPQRAIFHYKKAIQSRANNPQIYNNMANALAQQGKYNEAAEYYRKALDIRPLNPQFRYNMANTLYEQGKGDQALEQYRRAVRLNPNYVEAHNNIGNILADQGKIDEAMAAYRQALRINPSFAQACYNAGFDLAKYGRIDEAIHYYTQALQIDPNYTSAHNNLAIVLAQQGKFDEAIAHYRIALSIEPLRLDTNYNLALALAESGRTTEAIEQFRRLLQIQPNHTHARKKLQQLLTEKHN